MLRYGQLFLQQQQTVTALINKVDRLTKLVESKEQQLIDGNVEINISRSQIIKEKTHTMSESQSDLQDISLDSENGEFDEEAEPPDKFDNENGYKETKVQALLVWKRQRHCWCRSVCGGRVDRESF